MWNYQFQNNDLVLSGDPDEPFVLTEDLGQDVLVLFCTWYGTSFFDTTFGIPYLDFNDLISSKPMLDALVRRAIQDVPTVKSIISFNTTFTKGIYSVTCDFTTINSDDLTSLTFNSFFGAKNQVQIKKKKLPASYLQRNKKLLLLEKFKIRK